MIRFTPRIVSALALVALAAPAPAAVTDFTLTAGKDLDTITLDVGGTFDANDLVNVTLADIDDSNVQMLYFRDTPVPSDRSSVIEDLSLNTGFANLGSAVLVFNTPIVNRSGIDFILFDYGGQSETFEITINGTTQSYTTPDHVESGAPLLLAELYAGGAVASVADLESASFGSGSDSSAGGVGAYGIELTDFGISAGASVASLTFDNGDTENVDPLLVLGVQAVPAPAALPAGLATLAIVASRRRRR